MVGNEAYCPQLYHLETNRVFQIETPSIYYSCFNASTGFLVIVRQITDATEINIKNTNKTTGRVKCHH